MNAQERDAEFDRISMMAADLWDFQNKETDYIHELLDTGNPEAIMIADDRALVMARRTIRGAQVKLRMLMLELDEDRDRIETAINRIRSCKHMAWAKANPTQPVPAHWSGAASPV